MSKQVFVQMTDRTAHENNGVWTQITLLHLYQSTEPNFFTLLNIYITKNIKIKNATKNFNKYKNLQDI